MADGETADMISTVAGASSNHPHSHHAHRDLDNVEGAQLSWSNSSSSLSCSTPSSSNPQSSTFSSSTTLNPTPDLVVDVKQDQDQKPQLAKNRSRMHSLVDGFQSLGHSIKQTGRNVSHQAQAVSEVFKPPHCVSKI